MKRFALQATTRSRLRAFAWLFALLLVSSAGARGGVFREVSRDWGLAFRHHHGGSGSFYMVETMGSGVVLFDFDADGDTDVLYLDSGELPGYEGETPGTKLFRNDGERRFVEWPEAGIAPQGYAMGAVAGDVDRDGDLDLYVTEFGANGFFLNRGDGTFEPVAGASDPAWSTASALADVDGDGDLDLYVANYVDFTLDNNKTCGGPNPGLRSYCHPDVYNGVEDSFWLNDGAGGFSRTAAMETRSEAGKGLGALFLDDDDDGLPDLYVANDMTANLLFRNRGGGRFEEEGLVSGVAYSERGEPEAGMGLAAGDLDGDGQIEIFVTHLDRQSNAIYGRRKEGFYVDERRAAGMIEASFDKVGFGTVFADVENDGDLDVLVANGHIIHNIEEWGTGSTYRQRNQLFVNDGSGRLAEAADAGFDAVRSSRGLAAGDLDGDGDLDLVVNNSNDSSEVYENSGGPGGWAAVALRSEVSEGFGIGGRVSLFAAGSVQSQEMRTGASYLSQSPLIVHFGVADTRSIETLEIKWPSGRRQQAHGLPVGRRFVFYELAGTKARAGAGAGVGAN